MKGVVALGLGELVAEVADKAGLTRKEAKAAIEAVVSGIQASLVQGGRVRISGLGVFTVAERKARRGRNLRTGQEIEIPARRVVKFKASKGLGAKIAAAG